MGTKWKMQKGKEDKLERSNIVTYQLWKGFHEPYEEKDFEEFSRCWAFGTFNWGEYSRKYPKKSIEYDYRWPQIETKWVNWRHTHFQTSM